MNIAFDLIFKITSYSCFMQLKWFQQKGNNQKQKLYLLARKVTTLQEKEKSGINSGALAEKKTESEKKKY